MARAAYSLKTLLGQINARFPYRDKASDGGIGDPAHAARVSDHNADASGVYHAYDFDHDPDSNGLDCYVLKTQLIESRDPRIKYIIFMRRIWMANSRTESYYDGVNAHDHHLHLSVVGGAAGDNPALWNLPFLSTSPAPTPAPTGTYCKYGDRTDNVLKLQKHMTTMYRGYNPYTPTGFYGDATKAGIKEFQARVGIKGPDADGSIVGPKTLAALTQRGFKP
jgi:hypothetical protein